MKPGNYVVRCVDAKVTESRSKAVPKGKYHVRLFFVVDDGEYRGVGLSQWLEVREPLSLLSKYVRHCKIALGRPPRSDDDTETEVFQAKRFVAFVGYSKKEHPKDSKFDDDLAWERKYEGDDLRVHELKKRLDADVSTGNIKDWSHIAHMSHTDPVISVGGGGGGHSTSTITSTTTPPPRGFPEEVGKSKATPLKSHIHDHGDGGYETFITDNEGRPASSGSFREPPVTAKDCQLLFGGTITTLNT